MIPDDGSIELHGIFFITVFIKQYIFDAKRPSIIIVDLLGKPFMVLKKLKVSADEFFGKILVILNPVFLR